MGNYVDKNIAMPLARKQIDMYRNVLEVAPRLLEVIRKFDGKVANKRLETAMKEVCTTITCRTSSVLGKWEIEYWENDRSILVETTSWDGKFKYNGAHYIKYNTYYLARDMFENLYGKFTNEDGRWIAENICKQIEHNMRELESNITKFTEELNRIDELEAQKKKLKMKIEEYNNGISWFANAYFDLKV